MIFSETHTHTLTHKPNPKKVFFSQMWRHTPVISALGRLKQKDPKFKANLSYQKKKKKKKEKLYIFI
jgi:hypothetical protein